VKKNTVKNCVEDLKKLRGLPPYNYPGNLVYADGIFANSIDRNYSKRVQLLAERQLAH
jgi:hypothetical protein